MFMVTLIWVRTTNVVYDCDEIPVAKNALVFLVVGLNGYWKIPVGYFLIDGLTGIERGNLLAKAIDLITETGVNLQSVTFDGASVNLSMCTSLGTSIIYVPNHQRVFNSYNNSKITVL
ncbi:THAP domain-containing protein 9 [Aphis craccivora]|uniref:THAP domain-containing protein 9 n=1 Tax=Aphis craccivora TaxID=307492 RepID=A0A6G0VNW5_APHCR|nr:THAP domain-containing protein 9 [Aphis craccivora]